MNKDSTKPEPGKVYRLQDGPYLCVAVSECRATLHPPGVPSKTISISAEAEVREVRK